MANPEWENHMHHLQECYDSAAARIRELEAMIAIEPGPDGDQYREASPSVARVMWRFWFRMVGISNKKRRDLEARLAEIQETHSRVLTEWAAQKERIRTLETELRSYSQHPASQRRLAEDGILPSAPEVLDIGYGNSPPPIHERGKHKLSLWGTNAPEAKSWPHKTKPCPECKVRWPHPHDDNCSRDGDCGTCGHPTGHEPGCPEVASE